MVPELYQKPVPSSVLVRKGRGRRTLPALNMANWNWVGYDYIATLPDRRYHPVTNGWIVVECFRWKVKELGIKCAVLPFFRPCTRTLSADEWAVADIGTHHTTNLALSSTWWWPLTIPLQKWAIAWADNYPCLNYSAPSFPITKLPTLCALYRSSETFNHRGT